MNSHDRPAVQLLLLVLGCGEPATSSDRGAPDVTPVALDARGLPRLLHANPGSFAPAATATESARRHLTQIAPAYGVAIAELPVLQPLGEVRVRGGAIVRFAQRIDGIPIEDGELRVLVRPGGELALASGTLVGTRTPHEAPAFRGELAAEPGAIAAAVRHAYGVAFDRAAVTIERARATRAWHRTGNRLVAAWVVDAYASASGSSEGDAFRTVIADDGRVLARRSLVADAAFSYRVFAEATGDPLDGPVADPTPHPTGAPDGAFPPYITPNLVVVDGLNQLIDPWLAADATTTQGNNVDAYADFNAPSGLSDGDFRATTTAAGVFDRSYDTASSPLASQNQQMAGVTSLFYAVNWLHDFWYDAGFDEAAGNGQASNYGRGGIEGDAILAEAQDNALGGSRNNANMATPADGMPPRMQVFLWSGDDDRSLSVADRAPTVGAAAFGASGFDVTAPLVVADDGAAPESDACGALLGDATGAIVVVDRGACTFKSKALQVQNAGGVAMIVVDNQTSSSPPQMANDINTPAAITIGVLSVTLAEGAAIKANVAGGPTQATLHRLAVVDLEGSLDSTVIAHEFGHYVHHRLSACDTRMCGALSEGWGDFAALLLLARPGDHLEGAFPFGVYAAQTLSDDPAYFGIRRAPYSVNPSINALSFRHMANGEPLPTNHPLHTINGNAEIHNAGEIWASALWEGYVALQRAGSDFATVRQNMAAYVVAGLLLTPTDASPTETRDAILAAAYAASPDDHDILLAGFARRGFGSCAVSPPAESTDFVGIVESLDVRGQAIAGEPTIDDSVDSCDHDGVLDAGETARIRIPIGNAGHAAVTDAQLVVTSTTPGLTVVTPAVSIGTVPPYTTIDREIDIRLDTGVTTIGEGALELELTASNGCLDRVTTSIKLRFNVDELAASSATDAFDAIASPWSPTTDGEPGWTQRHDGLDGSWHGADLGVRADTSLVSPTLTADPDLPLIVSFSHRYSFESSGGGVVEISRDGTTWTDVSELGVSPGYGDPIVAADNPLDGRAAYVRDNPSYPGADVTSLEFGTRLAGSQFRLRFRIGSDDGVAGAGWQIDDVALSGIVGTPFPVVVADACGEPDEPDEHEPVIDGSGCCDARPLQPATGALALGVGVLVLRRRRRSPRFS